MVSKSPLSSKLCLSVHLFIKILAGEEKWEAEVITKLNEVEDKNKLPALWLALVSGHINNEVNILSEDCCPRALHSKNGRTLI